MQPNLFRLSGLALTLAVFGLLAFSFRGGAQSAQTFKAADLAWMSGDWETAPGRSQTDEHWTRPAGGSLFGVSRTVAGDRTVFFEYLRIETRPDGIYYIAHPKARTPGTDFKLVKLAGQQATFENLAHDFPKRILYRKNADGSLTARVEGDGSEKEKPQEFQYRPIALVR